MEATPLRELSDARRYLGEGSVIPWEAMDPLTFDHEVEQLLASRLEHQEHALLWMEVEGLTDSTRQDETVGEALAQQVIKLLSLRLGHRAPLARLDTSRFAVLMRDCPPAQALQVARVLRTVMQNTGFYRQGEVVYLGIHIGLVSFNHRGGKAEILAATDAACRSARLQGFNSIHLLRLD